MRTLFDRPSLRHRALGAALALGTACSWPAAGQSEALEAFAPARVSAETYDHAAGLLASAVEGTVRNVRVEPHWSDDGESFWYRRDAEEGHEFIHVNAATGSERPAFDHAALADALERLRRDPEPQVDAHRLDIVAMSFEEEPAAVRLRTPLLAARCDLTRYVCTREPGPATDPFEIWSPDGARAVFVREADAWLRDTTTGAEKRLTDDGMPHYAYGGMPGWMGQLELLRNGLTGPPVGASWSPDSLKLVLPRVDEREVREYRYYESLPPDGSNTPRVWSKRIALMGDAKTTAFETFLFDVETGGRHLVPLPPDCMGVLDAMPPTTLWARDSQAVSFVCIAPDASQWELITHDLRPRQTRTRFRETVPTWLDLNHSLYKSMGPNVRLLEQSDRAIVFSQRDGWGHLYLVDLQEGEIATLEADRGVRQLTRGEFVVHDLLHVDEGEGWVYFTAGGREPGRNPYWRHVYRAPLAGGELELLSPEPADHAVTVDDPAALIGARTTFSPTGRFFVDTYSTIQDTPVSVLRRSDGSVVTTLERADASSLQARGYVPPESFTAKAADGTTDLYGVLFRPHDWEPGKKYPVIEFIYGGPQTNLVPHSFARAAGVERVGGQGDAHTFAALGFAVVVMDARGTPWRSKAFHDFMWKKHHEFALDDHVAAIRQLGERHPWLDLDRVGVTGHSWGGYSSALAMLRHPGFYKVAVSSAGPYDYRYLYPAFVKWTGWPEYEDGGRIAPDDTTRPLNLTPHAALADRLEGKLLIVYAEHDENTLPASTLSFVDALIQADRDFDLLVLPNRDHFYTHEPYFVRRRWDYFVEHLLGAEPPSGYSIQARE